MRRLTVLSVFGTRPEAIKMVPIWRALAAQPDVQSVVCCTGQHRELIDQVLDLFEIRPDFDLRLMTADQQLPHLTADLLKALHPVVRAVEPDWLLAQGDTTTTMVVGLMAFYTGVRFGHVEAGLRTGDLATPFPEELNRRIADATSTMLFAPTSRARANLLAEGIADAKIHITGNTIVDAVQATVHLPFDWARSALAAIPRDRRLLLVTMHRRESFGSCLREMCNALSEIAAQYRDRLQVVYPVHLNPHVQETARDVLGAVPNVSLVPPLDYQAFIHLVKASTLVMTDSGGVQEECPVLGVPVIVVRERTERVEGIECGAARLVGTSRRDIVHETSRVLDGGRPSGEPRPMNPYGDGQAAKRIVQALMDTPASS